MKKTTNLLNLDELSEEERQNPLFQSYILSFISSLIADYDNDNTFIFQLLNQQKDMVIGRDSIIRTILVTYLEKFGFEKRGIIYVDEKIEPIRYAYELNL